MNADIIVMGPGASLATAGAGSEITVGGLGAATPEDVAMVKMYLAGLGSDSSRLTKKSKLDVLARMLGKPDAYAVPWTCLTPRDMVTIRAMLARHYSSVEAANNALGAVYRILEIAERAGLIREAYRLTDPNADGRKDWIAGSADPEPAGRMLDAAEIRALYETAAHDVKRTRGARDAAALALAHGAGLRRAEVCALHVADVDLDASTVKVRRGKGGKSRTVPMPAGAVHYVRAWLDVRGVDAGPLLTGVSKAGAVTDPRAERRACATCGRHHLSPIALHRALADESRPSSLAARAGVRFALHDCRRTFVSVMLDGGADIAAVADVAGHSSVDMTRRYDRRTAEARQRAVGHVRVPIIAAA